MAVVKKEKALPFPCPPTAADALRFARLSEEILHAPWANHRTDAGAVGGIGTLGEKRLHATVKRYLCDDVTCHERLVGDMAAEVDEEGNLIGKKRRMVADILTEGRIFEVQTGGFYPLQKKIDWYLTHTACHITVVHPLPAVRYLSWIDPADGHIISRRKSPKRGQVKHIAKELYWLSPFIGNPRFSIRLLLLELEEYRMADGWSRDGKRGSNRYERFPTALLGDVNLATAADYALYFLPDTLSADEPFTAATYATATGIRGKATYSMLHLLCDLGLLAETEKIGRAQGYLRT